jgi:dipeptidyl aminopeptidase/acylaminoacyl peptidase
MTNGQVLRFRAILLSTILFLINSVAASELPVEAFSRLPNIESPTLSPDGSKIAFIQNVENPEQALLMYVDLTSGMLKKLLQTDNLTNKIRWFRWGNNETILLGANFTRHLVAGKVDHTQLLAIDVGAQQPVQRRLINSGTVLNMRHYSQYEDNVIDFLPDDPAHILIALDAKTANLPSVFKLNINTSDAEKIENRKLKIRQWMSDQQGHVRLGRSVNYKTGETEIFVRKGDNPEWQSLFRYNGLDDPPINALGFGKNPNILYYNQYENDKKALFKVDLSTDIHQLVYADKDYDVDGSLIYSRKTREVIGIQHVLGNVYWDESRESLQQRLDTARPKTENYLVDFSKDEYVYLFYTENDYTPGVYFLANRKTGKVSRLMTQYPALKEANLTEHQLVEYTASDGTKIEGYLTLPKDTKGPTATILFPHGGPGARETGGFDYWTSFFTNRGYAVFRPNFRGSSGYGYEFAQSQMKSWGLIMQDDLTDAAHWLVTEKIADPQRMCIVGASYGGYAAAMAAVKTPDLFKCAISFAGVSDLRSIVFKSRYYTNKKFVENQIGKDVDDLEARSPFHQAKNINIPILLLHGASDTVVDVRQSRKFAEELEDLGKSVEYIEFEDGDHYLSIQRNRHAAFKAMNNFLKQHLDTAD